MVFNRPEIELLTRKQIQLETCDVPGSLIIFLTLKNSQDSLI